MTEPGHLTVAHAAEPAEVVRLADAAPARRPRQAAPRTDRLARTHVGATGKGLRPPLMCDVAEYARRPRESAGGTTWRR